MSTGPLLVLSSVFGPAAITPYAITKRMFDAVTMVLSELLSPLWPAYGEALVRNDHNWIKKTFKKSIVLSMSVFIPIFIILSFIGQEVIFLWSNDESAVPSWSLLMICNVWTFLLLVVRILSMFLNGINQFKGQAIYGLVLPSTALLLGWYFADSISMTLSVFVMIFIGEFIRILFMSWESKRIMKGFNKSPLLLRNKSE
jgi:O-antigen/teichoic acid export membrane protein